MSDKYTDKEERNNRQREYEHSIRESNKETVAHEKFWIRRKVDRSNGTGKKGAT